MTMTRRFLPALAALLLAMSHVAAQPEPSAASDPLTISIDFTGKAPTEKGISVRQYKIKPVEVDIGKKKYAHWAATQGSAELGYQRSFYFTITDPKFREGKMPVLDMEVEFRQPSDAPVFVMMDTAAGSRDVGRTRGRSPEIKTLRLRVDDAFLGARKFSSDPKSMPSDGYDFRINSVNTDLELRRVTIRGYDLDRNIDVPRMFKPEGITTPNDVFAFHRDEVHVLTYSFKNLSRVDLDLQCRFALTNFAGAPLANSEAALKVSKQASSHTRFTFSTRGLPLGIYPLKLTVLSPTGDTVYERVSYLSVVSPEKLSKAKDGEFLYGLDVAMGTIHDKPRLMKWIDLMGADIVRSGGFEGDRPHEVRAALPTLEAAGLRVMAMCDPPKNTNDKIRAEQLAKTLAGLEQVAREFPQLKYWELGNEPDLSFFYPRAIEDYVTDFAKMSQALKRGNPNTFIMNGGFAYVAHRPESAQRVERVIELMDPQNLDGWAYHGHGPGDAAERYAHARIAKTLEKFGKGGKPLVETESGVAARTRPQELTQAATVVQKMIFAQSVKMPLFMWFRLFFLSEDYFCLVTDQEPRPSVLSYRNMVQQLRGLAYDRQIPLNQSDLQAHMFAADSGTHRALVAWGSTPVTHNVTFNLARDPNGALSATAVDMLGNAAPLPVTDDGSVTVPVGPMPVYIRWTAGDALYAVTQGRSILQAPPMITLSPRVPTTTLLTVRNLSANPVNATIRIKPKSEQSVAALPDAINAQLAPNSEKQIEARLRQAEKPATIQWPESYTVFVDVDDSRLDLTQMTIPETMPGNTGIAKAQTVAPVEGQFNFEKLGGKRREKACAIVFAEIHAEQDVTVRVGGSADWWMQWFLNGKPVFDTLERGNGGRTGFTDHIVKLPLKKGRNLLAVRQLSGKDGWTLALGNPDMLAAALSRQAGNEIIEATLEIGGRQVAVERIPLTFRPNLKPAGNITLESNFNIIRSRGPLTILEDVPVTNLFEKEPDSSKWYKGNADLSARAWALTAGNNLLTFIAVRDNTVLPLGPPASEDQHQTGDYARIAVAGESGVTDDVIVGKRDGKVMVITKTGDAKAIRAAVDSVAGITLYRVSIPLPASGESYRMNFVVGDDDGYGAKQLLPWADGIVPTLDARTWPAYARVK